MPCQEEGMKLGWHTIHECCKQTHHSSMKLKKKKEEKKKRPFIKSFVAKVSPKLNDSTLPIILYAFIVQVHM